MPKAKQKLLVNFKSRAMLPRYTDQQLTDIASSVGLTLEELKQLHGLAHQTYQYIGSDIAASKADMGEPEGMSREELVEVVLDANYMEQSCHPMPVRFKNWVSDACKQYGLEVVYAAVAAGFPYSRYE